MDDFVFLIMLAVALFGAPWVIGIVALVKAARAQRRIAALEAQAAELEQRLTRAGVKLEAPRPVSAWGVPAWPTTVAPTSATKTSTARPAVPLTPSLPPAPAGERVTQPGAPATLEETIALVWFTRAGALALLVGAAYFFKYAVDNDWIGPAGRVALGALAGLAALAGGELLRPRTRALWVNAVQGAGVALLLVAIFAAAALYHLVPFGLAFAAVAAVALAGAALALRGRSELVLALALAGGLLSPVVLSAGEDRPGGLLGWLLAVSALALGVSVRLRFRVVPWLAMAGSAALFAGWHERFFSVYPPPDVLDPNLPEVAQMGAYFPLAARALPLALALAHVAAWLAAWLGLTGGLGALSAPAEDRREVPGPWAVAWLGAALLGAHLAPFALLYDHPVGAGAAIALAGTSVS